MAHDSLCQSIPNDCMTYYILDIRRAKATKRCVLKARHDLAILPLLRQLQGGRYSKGHRSNLSIGEPDAGYVLKNVTVCYQSQAVFWPARQEPSQRLHSCAEHICWNTVKLS